MAIPIINFWEKYFTDHHEGLGSTYERFIINDVLFKAVKHYKIKSVLESPCFGFTGLSGINSLGLALDNVNITINDNDEKRLELIKQIWSDFDVFANFDLINDFSTLPYEDKCFDMSWNFSALWFVSDLSAFLTELDRVTRKIILIMVPNRTGLGYLHQKYTGKEEMQNTLKEENIVPKNFISPLEKLDWILMHDDYIDCPLWPDIGMSKEDFIKKYFRNIKYPLPPLGRGVNVDAAPTIGRTESAPTEHPKPKTRNPMTILDYYRGKDPQMRERLRRLNLFEKYAPNIFKKIWAHHHYYLFLKR